MLFYLLLNNRIAMSEEKKNIPNISKDVYVNMLNEIYTKIAEERDMSIDRYRVQDEQMQNADDFILQGKNAISFLNHASNRTDALFGISKEIKSIVFKDGQDDSGSGNGAAMSDDKRRALAEFIKKSQVKEEEEEDVMHDEDLINDIADEDDLELGKDEEK